ncbi:MAG: hypothetical protein HQK77_08115 [Desulfobacterales bacterium]|nr:hypothetical protein [Desulfobacterales bacterium]
MAALVVPVGAIIFFVVIVIAFLMYVVHMLTPSVDKVTDQAKIKNVEICPFCKTPDIHYDYLGDLFCPKCKKIINPTD